MSDIEMVVAFDLAEAGFGLWWFPAFGLYFIAIGVVMVVVKHAFRAIDARMGHWFSSRFKRKRNQPTGWLDTSIQYVRDNLAEVCLGFALAWTTTMFAIFFMMHQSYASLRDAYLKGLYGTVEGRIEHVQPALPSGDSADVLEVDGQRLSFTGYACFSSIKGLRSRGASLEKGVRVRIGHVGNWVVRLEIEQTAMEYFTDPTRRNVRMSGFDLLPGLDLFMCGLPASLDSDANSGRIDG